MLLFVGLSRIVRCPLLAVGDFDCLSGFGRAILPNRKGLTADGIFDGVDVLALAQVRLVVGAGATLLVGGDDIAYAVVGLRWDDPTNLVLMDLPNPVKFAQGGYLQPFLFPLRHDHLAISNSPTYLLIIYHKGLALSTLWAYIMSRPLEGGSYAEDSISRLSLYAVRP